MIKIKLDKWQREITLVHCAFYVSVACIQMYIWGLIKFWFDMFDVEEYFRCHCQYSVNYYHFSFHQNRFYLVEQIKSFTFLYLFLSANRIQYLFDFVYMCECVLCWPVKVNYEQMVCTIQPYVEIVTIQFTQYFATCRILYCIISL